MEGIVEVVSSTNKGFRIEGQPKGAWYNKGMRLSKDFSTVKKGMKIIFDSPDGKWVTAWKLDGEAGDAGSEPSAPAQMPDNVKAVFKPQHDGQTEKSNSIARGCATNAVLGSTYILELLQGGSSEESLQNIKNFMEKVSEWVYGGKW